MSFKVVVKLKTKKELMNEGWVDYDGNRHLYKKLDWLDGDFWIPYQMLQEEVILSIKEDDVEYRNLYPEDKSYSYPIEMFKEIISYEGELPVFMKELVFKKEMNDILNEKN